MTAKPFNIPAIQVLERAFALLDALAAQPGPVSLRDLSANTRLPPSTAHRILNDLTLARYVERPQPGCYRLGLRLLELGAVVQGQIEVRAADLGSTSELRPLTPSR